MRIILIAMFFMFTAVSCSSSGSKSANGEKGGTETSSDVSYPEENLKLVHLDVKGMTCEGCENTIVKSIRNLDGIQEASASHTAKETMVKFDSTKTSLEDISKAIADAGYSVGGEKPQVMNH